VLETRHEFRESLKELERQTLEGLEMAIQQLDRALESVSHLDVELAGMIVAEDRRVDARYVGDTPGGCRCSPARRRPPATCGSSRRYYTSFAASSGWAISA
jgi:hypothetical protein